MATTVDDVALAVKRLQWRHHRDANRRLASLRLSLVQWDVMRHLDREPDASLHRLAVLTFQTDQAMGELARRMIDRGLLRRREGTGRIVRHELTDEGERLRSDGARIVHGVFDETVGRLDDEERATLLRLATRALGDDAP
ncbi:DNA-binding transcriptional regulator, MarR family [Rathayibacter oskolensis]|uniref:DNA-binding transcriptional regulator, MarR family n=1 Tax=Rathayibacter oskolensis TaxID=1891671 RepID=A0A1X7MUI0_9MICO|nr:MarR family transcriptional regulator [Rathayibacter oskolensis]SMH28500.1 DNA-binding transcriptional regulator, MarR family [Rathayibacter oskolensis]